ncbi:MAG: 23S rRNA pseudouridine(1911/1915/1917) synthase RluD [Gammaproteobacteria bacterium]|nr:23S rRNA pseudouridine(1911/1915/1917) synthase RluD [Gammaproteobacteria bacterium]
MTDDPVEAIELRAEIPAEAAGRRLDRVLAELFPDYSRSRLQGWIRDGRVALDDGPRTRPREPVAGGETVTVSARVERDTRWTPEPIPLRIVHEDEDLVVIDKPAGLVTHPAAGNWHGTLVNGLLHRYPGLAALPRAGVVHRLDKDTTGLLVVARTVTAHAYLVEALARREIRREYLALVHGVPTGGGTVDAPIGRHRVDRTRMAVVAGGRSAVTHFTVAERFRAHALLAVRLETGRTHQIRVHLAHLRHPIVGDPVYGGRPRPPPGAGEALLARLAGFQRQALHAARLALAHPRTGVPMAWEAPLPDDLAELLVALGKEVADG